jgi:hypothetical protein
MRKGVRDCDDSLKSVVAMVRKLLCRIAESAGETLLVEVCKGIAGEYRDMFDGHPESAQGMRLAAKSPLHCARRCLAFNQ